MNKPFFGPMNAAADGGAAGGGASGGAAGGAASAGGAAAGGAAAGGAATGAAAVAAGGSATGGAAGAAAGGAAAGTPAPWHSDFVRSDGTLNAESYARLPDHLKHLPEGSLKNAKTLEDVFMKVSHLETLAGKKALAPLPSTATPEQVAERNSLMRAINGVPEKASEYGITKPTDMPDFAWNQKAVDGSLAIMHKHNISPAAAKELAQWQITNATEQLQAQAQYEKQFFDGQEQTFRDQVQKDGVAYDKALDLATRGARTFGLDPADPVFKNAGVRLALMRAANAVSESRLVAGDGSAGSGAEGDRAKAERIIHDKTSADYKSYWDANHPQNATIKKQVATLLANASRLEQAAAAQSAGRR